MPLGVGWSSSSFLRATSCSPSRGVWKNPPASSSANRSTASSREPVRLEQPARVAARDVQLHQPVCDVGVVLEVTRSLRDAVPPGAVQPAVRCRQIAEEKAGQLGCRLDAPSLGERREHQAVPGGDRLVVAERLRPLLAQRVQPLARVLVELAAQNEAAVLERLQQFLRRAFARRPRERQPLDTFGVGVLRRGEPAALERELAQHVVDRQVGDPPVALVAEPARGVQVHRGEQRVVVQHLLEVRHEPALVDGVAVEAAADDVPHAAEDHRVEREARHLPPRRGGAGTRAPARAGTSACGPSRPTEGRNRRAGCSAPGRAGRRRAARGDGCSRAPERMCSASCAAERSTSPRCSSQASATERSTCLNEGSPCRGSGGKYVPAEERLAGRGQEDRHRPAALPGQRDDGVHVDRVEIGPLLAVDLDADEALVHHPRRERRPRTTRAPSRGTSGRPRSRSRAGSAGPRRARGRAPPLPTDTSRPDCRRAAGDTARSPRPGGSHGKPRCVPRSGARKGNGPRVRTGTYALATRLGGATAAR